MITTVDQGNLRAWSSDKKYNTTNTPIPNIKKFDIVEFYHQILWASQQQQEQQQQQPNCEEEEKSTKRQNKKRVRFSKNPPMIYEYEPEYIKNRLFDYSYFKRKFHQYYHSTQQIDEGRLLKQRIAQQEQQKQQYVYQPPTTAKVVIEEVIIDKYYQHNHRLMKTRSLSEFRPVRNQQFTTTSNNKEKDFLPKTSLFVSQHQQETPSSLAHINALSTTEKKLSTMEEEKDNNIDPPPSYIEYNVASGDTNSDTFHLYLDKVFNNTTSTLLEEEEDIKRCDSGNAGLNTNSSKSSKTVAAAPTKILYDDKKKQVEEEEEKGTNAEKPMHKNSSNTGLGGGAGGKAFFQRTLQRMKSSQKLLKRKSSMIPLRTSYNNSKH